MLGAWRLPVIGTSITLSHLPMLRRIFTRSVLSCVVFTLAGGALPAQEPAGEPAPWRDLAEQNRRLQEQVKEQQRQIEALAAKLTEVQQAGERHERQLQELREGAAGPAPATAGNREQEIRLSGEAGLAFFNTGAAGQFPKAEFRVDDARVFVEAPVVKDVYFFGGLDLQTREANDENLRFGELYADFENVSGRLGGPDRVLNVRAGRFNIPFGEEYLVRNVLDNPLISHSLSDVWGMDNGVEVYGGSGQFQYVLAVQNGGDNPLHDYNADKSLTTRVGWEAAAWLHLSASAMRTGELNVTGDALSEVWFADAFFRALGPAKSTTSFWADLYEGDATARWKDGQLRAALGSVRFDDNDTATDNSRRLRYGYVEVMQKIAGRLRGAARYSEIQAGGGGYPLAGWGNLGRYFFSPALTERLRRLSLGFGYQFGPPLVLKLEYTAEWGRQTNGARRDQEDFLGTEVGLKF